MADSDELYISVSIAMLRDGEKVIHLMLPAVIDEEEVDSCGEESIIKKSVMSNVVLCADDARMLVSALLASLKSIGQEYVAPGGVAIERLARSASRRVDATAVEVEKKHSEN